MNKLWSSAQDFVASYARIGLIIWQAGPAIAVALLLLTPLAAAVPTATFVLTKNLVNSITLSIGRADWWRHVGPWLGALVALRVADAIAQALREPLRTGLAENLEAWVNQRIAWTVHATNLEEVQTPAFQDGLARARGLTGPGLLNLIWALIESGQRLISAVMLSFVLWAVSPLLAVLPFCIGLMDWTSMKRFGADVYQFSTQTVPARRERDALANLLCSREAAKEIRLYQAAQPWLDRWESLWVLTTRGLRNIDRGKFWIRLILSGIGGLLYAAALVVLLRSVISGGLTIGAYVAGASALVQVEGIWMQSSSRLNAARQSVRQLRGDLLAFFDRWSPARKYASKLDARSSTAQYHGPGLVPLALRGVSFSYPDQPSPALENVSITIAPGQRIAIVGPNGAGKSTLARVLLGLYRPSIGEVCVDGLALDPASHTDWWQSCSGVFQDFTQYHLTARENIGFGELSLPERVPHAAQAADAADVVENLSAGYDTLLGPTFGGQDLSGGQWQRLATARGFMRQCPSLVVLDEPTAALDPLAELSVYERFAELTEGRTAVLISHRLASARLCDRILVLDCGRIVEDGTHQELMAVGGLYAKLFKAQAEWYADDTSAVPPPPILK